MAFRCTGSPSGIAIFPVSPVPVRIDNSTQSAGPGREKTGAKATFTGGPGMGIMVERYPEYFHHPGTTSKYYRSKY